MSSSSFPPDNRRQVNLDPHEFAGRSARYGGWQQDAAQAEQVVEDPYATSVSSRETRRRGGVFREIIETALIAILIFVAVRSLVLNFRVDGNSMLPNLTNGEMLLVNRNAYESFDLYALVDWIPGVDHAEAKDFTPFDDPQRGDIVVFNPPVASSKPYIKRIIGLPGESIEIRDGAVFVNGVSLDEPYLEDEITDCGQRDCETVEVPEGHIYVMGDNRRNSSDSRTFGPVPVASVQGKAWVVYWPVSEMGQVDAADYPDE